MEFVCTVAEILKVAGPYVAAAIVAHALYRTHDERRNDRAALHARLVEASHSQAVAIEKVEVALTSFRETAQDRRIGK